MDEDVSLICAASSRKSILSLPQAQDKEKKRDSFSAAPASLNTPVKAAEDRVVALKQALCVQLAVDAFASELEVQVQMSPNGYLILSNNVLMIPMTAMLQGVPPGIAYATAIDTYLSNPSAFGLAQPVPSRGKSCLIAHTCIS